MLENFHRANYFLNNRNIRHLQQVLEFLRVSPRDVIGQYTEWASYKPSSEQCGAFDSGFFQTSRRGKPQCEGEEGTDREGGRAPSLVLCCPPPALVACCWGPMEAALGSASGDPGAVPVPNLSPCGFSLLSLVSSSG